jgi:hypothetical protein
MKVFLLFFAILLYVYPNSCIIVYSAKNIPAYQEKKFFSIFKGFAIKEKQRKYQVLKIGAFKQYKEALKLLPKVKKQYKDSFIVTCKNPLAKEKKGVKKPRGLYIGKNSRSFEKYLTPCKNCIGDCQKCIKKKNSWEIDQARLYKNTNININRLKIISPKQKMKSYSKDNNKTCYNSLYRFYYSGGVNIYNGQKDTSNKKLRGEYANFRVGLQYGCYFDIWKFYTDSRLVLSQVDTDVKNSTSLDFDVKEFYIRSYNILENRANLLLGRKKIKDSRSWWYNNNLDVLKVFNEHDLVTYGLYLGTRINSIIDNGNFYKDINNDKFFIANINDQFYIDNFIRGYYIWENKSKRNLHWFGARVNGNKTINNDTFRYWLDFGKVFGQNEKNINDYAYDTGVLYIPQDSKNSYGIGYATATEDYTQPLIANNKSRYFNGKIDIKYYGFYLDPTLHNIKILSLYWFRDLSEKEVLGISFHNYSKYNKSFDIDATRYIYQPSANDGDIGKEIDLFYKFTEALRYNYRIVFSYFKGGNSYSGVTNNRNGINAKFDFIYYW